MLWVFRFLSVWPLSLLHAIGSLMGWVVWGLSPGYREQFRANSLQAGFSFERVRPAIAETGRFVAELPRLWMRPQSESCLANVRVEGQSEVTAAFAEGRGVIFFSAHCGSFETAPQALAELFGPITAIYRPARKAWLARLESIARNRPNLTVLPASLKGIRQMQRALRANQAVALLTDQVPPEGQGVWSPFFGKPAYTMTLAARLALQNGAKLLPVSCDRLSGGRGFSLRIWPALDMPAAGRAADPDTLLKAVTQVNQAIEAIVRAQPGQYLWAYARYKQPRAGAPTDGLPGNRSPDDAPQHPTKDGT